MSTKTNVVISGLVDATIKEYSPDIDFKLFRNIDDLAEYLEESPIRADILFFTRDITSGSNAAFAYLKDILAGNDFIKVDRVIYITEESSSEISALRYLMDECNLDNWEIIEGTLSRTFVQEVVHGTFREDIYDVNRKVVIRRPRSDYIKEQLNAMKSLDEEYEDDDHALMDIPDEELPEQELTPVGEPARKVYIAGQRLKERTAFALLAAQYLSRSSKVLMLESDPDYHLLTEFVTKAKIECSVVTVTDLYDNLNRALDNIRNAKNNLVVIECVDRIDFNYQFLLSLLYHNVAEYYDYILCEVDLNEIPDDTPVTVVTPSTITDLLATGEHVDKSLISYCRFVGVDLGYLSETHVSSGVVMGKILNDILSESNIICPVVTVSSLRLDNTPYDLGGILGKGVLL